MTEFRVGDTVKVTGSKNKQQFPYGRTGTVTCVTGTGDTSVVRVRFDDGKGPKEASFYAYELTKVTVEGLS